MSKHKRIHTFNGRNYAKFAGFVAARYPLPKKIRLAGSTDKKTTPGGETEGGGGRT